MLLTSAPLTGVAPKPTTDPLKQATDRILKEQQVALQNAAMYKSKLDEVTTYSSRLEKAYQALVKNNSGLRAKVASDYSLVQDFSTRFDAQNGVLASHEKRFALLAGELALVKTQREELAKSRADVESVAKRLSKDLSEANAEVQTLRTHLSEASQKCTTFEAQLKTCSEELASHKASAEQHASLLTSSLEETKAELCAVKSTFAEQEEASRLQLSIATTAAADLSLQLEEKLTAIQKLEEKLHSVDDLSKELEETRNAAATAAGRVAELEAELTSEKQRYEQLSQQSDADRTAAALAMEEAAKKFSLELSEALTNAKSESEKELGAERERMSAEIARMQAEHNAKLDSLTTNLAAASKQTAADEKEKARLENLLDERALIISQLDQKCSEHAVEITKLQHDLNVSSHEAISTAEKAAKLQQELEETTEELEEKRVALESISAFAGKQNTIFSAVPAAPVSALKKRRATASPPPAHNTRMKHKACFDDPISRTIILEDQDEEIPEQPYESELQEDGAWGFNNGDHDDDDEEEEEVDEEALRTAIVIHPNTNNQASGNVINRPMRKSRMRQTQVIVEEVDDSDEESYEVPPRALHRNKPPAMKPAKPCIKPTTAGGGSRAVPKSRLAAMRPANSFKPSNAARRSKAAKIVVSKNRGIAGGDFGSQQHTNQNHTLFNLFGGLGNASPGDI